LVIDAPVIATWFAAGERPLRDEYEAGALVVCMPPHARLELIDLLAVRAVADIDGLISAIDRLRFEFFEVPAAMLGSWIRHGLSAGAASYAALAESLEVPLVTLDPNLHAAAGPLIMPMGISGYPKASTGELTHAAR
jgi:predicted nucleic acid-binding protein